VTFAVVALALTLAGALSLVAWLVRVAIARTDKGSDAALAAEAGVSELERAIFERDAAIADAAESHRIAEHLAGELRHALATPPAPGLDPGDVSGRVLRAFDRYASARSDRAVRADSGAAVPDTTAAVADGGRAPDGT
jgi:hypothetical protein